MERLTGSLRVLVVEDEFLIATMIAMTLEGAGHRVVGRAASADKALRLLDGAEVDVAIVDIRLQGAMDGIDLAQRLHRRGVPHVFISGSREAALSPRAQATKPLAFLQKPFEEAHLLAVLDDLRQRV